MSPAVLRPRLRLVRGKTVVLGPGKADLLAAIDATGSLRRAAARLGMSYMRAWTLVKTMNGAFREPLVVLARGGARHGGATLTPAGKKVLVLYRRMERSCEKATSSQAERLKTFLRR